jgi:hypothetical protein
VHSFCTLSIIGWRIFRLGLVLIPKSASHKQAPGRTRRFAGRRSGQPETRAGEARKGQRCPVMHQSVWHRNCTAAMPGFAPTSLWQSMGPAAAVNGAAGLQMTPRPFELRRGLWLVTCPSMDKLKIALWVMLAVLILAGIYMWFAPQVIDWTIRI